MSVKHDVEQRNQKKQPSSLDGHFGIPPSHFLAIFITSGQISKTVITWINPSTNWWTSTRPGLHCFLICDNLSIHKNDSILKTARCKGIHMINIMPGTSHWFQESDQLPFGTLKKKMAELKSQTMPLTSLEPKDRRMVLTGHFYEAEKVAFEPRIVAKSFADVGLWPLLPDRILENCRKFCRVDSDSADSEEIKTLAEAVSKCIRDELDKTRKMLCEMKCVKLTSPAKAQKLENGGKKGTKSTEDKNAVACASTKAHIKPTTPQIPKKSGWPPKSDGE